ncbi:MAG: MFS transporter [Tannerella sp.]|jgi:EmrB/QacA subfamily drug resistance transporter|nr:MFS transporter [Tannerella sp.]
MQKNSAFTFICLASFLVPFMGSAINLSLPQIGSAFSMKAVSLTWIATSYLIATAISQVPFARLGDMVGRRKVFICGTAIFSVFTFLCGLAPSGTLLIVFRGLSGLGSAMMFGTSMAILISIFPPQRRGRAIGINTAVVYFALASGPFAGGLLTHHWGWKSLFFLTGIFGFFVVAGSLLVLKGEWSESKGEKFDFAGSIIYAAGLFGLILGFSRLPHALSFVCLLLGIAAFVLFVRYELKVGQPVFNVRIFSGNRVFGLSNLSSLINYACTYAVAYMMSLYLQYIRGFNAQHAGMILIVQAVVQCLVSLYAGKLSDRLNPAGIATTGMGVIFCGLCGLVFLSPDTPMAVVLVLLILLGVGFGLFSSPNANIVMSSVEKKFYGQASATIGTMRLVGQSFSMGIAMMAISLHTGNRLIVPELYPQLMKSFHMTFVVCGILCAVGTYTSTFRVKKAER